MLEDPAFLLNENLASRVASALAAKLGMSVSFLAEGVGSLVRSFFGR